MSLNSNRKGLNQEEGGADDIRDFLARIGSFDNDQFPYMRSQPPVTSPYSEGDDRKPAAAVDAPPEPIDDDRERSLDDRKPAAVDKPPKPIDDEEQQPFDDKSILQRAYDLIDFTARRFRRTSTTISKLDEMDVTEDGTPNDGDAETRLSPVAGRANAKAASAFVIASGSKQGRRGRSLVPGAEYVQTRAPGLSPSFYLRFIRQDNARRAREVHRGSASTSPVESNHSNTRHEISSLPANDLENADVTNERQSVSDVKPERWPTRRTSIVLVVLFLLAVGAAAAGVYVLRRKASIEPLATTPMELPTLSCDTWSKQKQPSVVTQCHCTGSITIVADDVEANYNKLKSNGFARAVYPEFNSTIDSCDPANQALLWLASATGTTSPQANLRQRFILALLFITWSGQKWTVNFGWLSSDYECSWKGVTCEVTGEAIGIDLYNNELSGHLDSHYSKLTGLKSLSLGHNYLAGSLPPELGLLTALTSLVIETNQLAGSLPNELSLITLLLELKLAENRLTGTVPTWIGQLLELQTLELFNNTLTSTLVEVDQESGGNYSSRLRQPAFPTEIGLLTNLMYLRLDSNELRGTLPTEIFKLGTTLQDFVVSGNALSGTIPNFVGNLGNLGLAGFDYNVFTGTIPEEFVQCTRLTFLYLNNNQLHGTVPDSFGLLPLLYVLDLNGNDLSGSIPKSICVLTEPNLCPTTKSNVTCSCCACN